tara:strand:+ start:17217 stop:17741 length:525 start_codon:yes stop_codon:yes gene_type:complete
MNQTKAAFHFHQENGIPISENIFRPHSENYYELFRYARSLNESTNLSDFDQYLLSTDIGELAMYEGVEVPLDHPLINEAEYKGREVELNEPKRGGDKKFYVYVKNDKGNVIKVQFGDAESGLQAKINDPAARKAFAARHNCAAKKDKTTPGYWSCNLPRYASELGLKGGGNFFW